MIPSESSGAESSVLISNWTSISRGSGQWPEIPGCNGYGAALDGQIVNLSTGQILAQRPSGSGYMQVHIGKSTRMVHDLVARAHYGHPLCRGYRVKHANGHRTDNNLDNLVWSGHPFVEKVYAPITKREPVLSRSLDAEYQDLRKERAELLELMQPDVGIKAPLRGSNRP